MLAPFVRMVELKFLAQFSLDYLPHPVLYSHLHHHSASQRHNIKDRRRNEGRMIKTHEGRHVKENAGSFFTTYSPLTLLQGFERVVEGLHVRGCRRPNVNFIFWPHCYDRHVVSLLFSWCWGPLHRGFPRAPSVWCGLPYHISSLTLWESAGNCFGGFPSVLSVGCGFPYHIWSLLSGILLTTALGPKLNWVK